MGNAQSYVDQAFAYFAQAHAALLALFRAKDLEVIVVGIENAGKTTLLSILNTGTPQTETLPTIGLNVVTFAQMGGVKIKAWDLGGQAPYREQWNRYARGCDVILFVVDTADASTFPLAKQELHRLLEDPALSKTPICVCANKIDIQPHASEAEIVTALNLDYITDQAWIIVPCSALKGMNVDKILQWLIKQ